EEWDDAKVFQVEVRDLGAGEQGAEGQGAGGQGAGEQGAGGQGAGEQGAGDFVVPIDAEETGAPISPYIYGAFIEHQGRCIYGGIWAEMLQDRKFYYPVEYYFPWGLERGHSPWRAIPFDTVVAMDTGNVFVGEHTPRIDLDGRKARGLRQDGLGLVAGREYEGYVFLAARDGPVEAEVRLVWGPAPEDQQTVSLGSVPEEYTRFPFRFTAGADTDDGRLEIVGRGTGSLYIGTASLMPADNVEGMRTDVLGLLKGLGFTVYRWPGGIFVNDYNWREAVGDRDRRPPRLNTAYWSEVVESNDFGPDEFMALCRLVGAEPYVVVSATGSDDAQMAAEEVEYLNGGPDTPMGRLRAANGHPEPYHVRFWGVGNEMWGFADIDEYIEQHNRIAEAMRAVDPSIQIVGVGGLEFEGLEPGETWTESMLAHSADRMDLISEHFYGGSSPVLTEHAASIAQGTREIVAAHRRYREQIPALQGRDVRLALDEWNYFWGDRDEIYGEAAPRYYLRDALGIARGLHEVFRNSDLVYMVNIHPVNVHGQIKTTQTEAAVEATGLVVGLYRNHFGTLPVAVRGDVGPLDVVAAWNEGRTALTVGVVNPTEYTHTLRLVLEGATWADGGRRWLISGSDPWAYNEPGRPPEVTVQEEPLDGTPDRLAVPPMSVVLFEVPTR
ncbi:MAG TPA: alpha-N-arabinofuranosidase, partial [Chloroflexi bacterium]|nr:alpha-N-arabinofuranosidase [Chloroflexota bacterium]